MAGKKVSVLPAQSPATVAALAALGMPVLITSGEISSPTALLTLALPSSSYPAGFLLDCSGLQYDDDDVMLKFLAQLSSDNGVSYYGDDDLSLFYNYQQFAAVVVSAANAYSPGAHFSMRIFPGSAGAAPNLMITRGEADATAQVANVYASLFHATGVSIANGGSGYSPADSKRVLGMAASSDIYIIVDTVDGGGAILTAHIDTSVAHSTGANPELNPNPLSLVGGATVNLTWGAQQVSSPVNKIRISASASNGTSGSFSDGHNVIAGFYRLYGLK